MFKHANSSSEEKEDDAAATADRLLSSHIAKGAISDTPTALEASRHPTPAPDLRTLEELLEKNLKWSQIIYEQNRKINHKLLWSTMAGWFRFFIILIPIALVALFIPQFVKDYNCLFNGVSCTEKSRASLDHILKILPLTDSQKDILKKSIQ